MTIGWNYFRPGWAKQESPGPTCHKTPIRYYYGLVILYGEAKGYTVEYLVSKSGQLSLYLRREQLPHEKPILHREVVILFRPCRPDCSDLRGAPQT